MKIFLTCLCLVSTTCFGQTTSQSNVDRRGNALQWVRESAEYHIAARQAYRLAKLQLDSVLNEPSFSADEVQAAAGGYEKLPPAIILDVDETVLDNSEYNVRRMQIGAEYESSSWKAWCDERAAIAVPGAVEFLNHAQSKGVQIFFVTNRADELRDATYDNLIKTGVSTTLDRVITRNNAEGRGEDKVSRRAAVAASHRIVLLVGDNFADLTVQKRDEFRSAPEVQDGWVMLPNPIYGYWETRPPAKASPPGVIAPTAGVSPSAAPTSASPVIHSSIIYNSPCFDNGTVIHRGLINNGPPIHCPSAINSRIIFQTSPSASHCDSCRVRQR